MSTKGESLRRPSATRLLSMFDAAMRFVPRQWRRETTEVLGAVWQVALGTLSAAVESNPLEHHLIVLGFMMEEAAAARFSLRDTRRAGALAMLHDCGHITPKITKAMVKEARKTDSARADALELQRVENRRRHMKLGAALAHGLLLEANKLLGRIAFDVGDIDAVCGWTSHHDDPSLGIPIPAADRMLVLFRQCDLNYRLTDVGLRADLWRDHNIAKPTVKQLREQREENWRRLAEERDIYSVNDGPFVDERGVYRSRMGLRIGKRLMAAAL